MKIATQCRIRLTTQVPKWKKCAAAALKLLLYIVYWISKMDVVFDFA